MGHSHTDLCYHIVFATKNRALLIEPAVEKIVWSILWKICLRIGLHPYAVGGVEDHVHVALSIPASINVAGAVGKLKNLATREIRESIPGFHDFEWQVGYGAFTFSYRDLDGVVRYIHNQRMHHERGRKAD
ncbi:MAG TPA: IS200/IS605 family transposase [Bacteroidetes bacterium]|nr:IS200/IS605 family transposase [Bacteroidota bacterium]